VTRGPIPLPDLSGLVHRKGECPIHDHPGRPGQRIKAWLKENGMTQTELARRMGISLKHLNQVVHGKVSLTPDMAWKLQEQTGITARSWAIMEAVYRTDLHRTAMGETVTETNYAVATGEYITEWLEEEKVSRAELEYALGVSETYLNSLLAGQIALSDDVARALERLTGVPVTSWQRLDAKYWEDKARLELQHLTHYSKVLEATEDPTRGWIQDR